MPVYHSDFDFGKAYQDHILRKAESQYFERKISEPTIGLRDRLLLYLGERLIILGNKLIPDARSRCIELVPKQA